MRILLRVLVVFLLILSGVALYLGHKLYLQREQIKARINLLEQSTADLSTQIETEVAPDVAMRRLPAVNVDIRDIKQYYLIDKTTGEPVEVIDSKTGEKKFISDGPGTMKPVLQNLIAKARQQTDTLDRTRVTVTELREALKRSQEKVATLKSKITELEGTIDSLREDIARLKEEAIDRENTIKTKEEQILTLNAQVEEYKIQVQKRDEQIFLQKNTLIALEKRNADLQDKLRRLEAERGLTGSTVHDISHGPKGTISKVNPEWSFVVVAVTPDTKLANDITLVVRRDGNLVGKIRILRIKPEQNLAIAEILWPWLRLPLQKGDIVDYISE
ncbi:MAG: hypothetical protein WCL44_08790 [bacterium]